MKRLLAIATLCVTAPAQQAPEPLEQVGRASAYGGDCSDIDVAPDQRHALTVGASGDFAWWDLHERKVLRHIAPIEQYISTQLLHPSGHWFAFCCTAGQWQGQVWGADLRTGECFLIADEYARDLAFDESGESLALHIQTDELDEYAFYDVRRWRLGCPAPERETDHKLGSQRFAGYAHRSHRPPFGSKGFSTSANGEHFVRWKRDRLETSFGDCTVDTATETWLERAVATDDGRLLVHDAIGLLHLLDNQSAIDLQVETRAPFAPHLGHADRMVFSPDGLYLAIQGLCATHIVALDGSTRLQLAGPHVIEPGENGSEFLIADRHRCYRWNATTRTEVGEPRCWQQAKPGFLRSGRKIGKNRPRSVWSVRAGLTAPDTKKRPPNRCVLDLLPDTAGYWQTVTLTDLTSMPEDLYAIDQTGTHLLHTRVLQFFSDASKDAFYLLDRDGNVTHYSDKPAWHEWLAIDAAHQRIWFGAHELHCLSTEDLSETTTFVPEREWLHAVTWQDGDLLMTDGKLLHVIEPMEEQIRHTFALPEGLEQIHMIAASPDRLHIAVADHYDVRILRVSK